jgi:tRNA-Thr(GGU) m(6)t(6)A37 methyltransferase TsaA
MEIVYHSIGVIRSPFSEPDGMPIQPCYAEGTEGEVELLPEYAPAVSDLDRFSHLHLIYHLHRASGYELKVVPYMDTEERGLFATRAPRRPNPIGLSVVRLLGVDGSRLRVADVDILDGTPLLDIKPFNPAVDHRNDCRTGWMEDRFGRESSGISDERFADRSGSSRDSHER